MRVPLTVIAFTAATLAVVAADFDVLPAGQTNTMRSDQAVARAACSTCHAFPPPDVLPRRLWAERVFQMAGLSLAGIGFPPGAPGKPLTPGEVVAAVRYYAASAPDALPSPEPWPDVASGGSPFLRRAVALNLPRTEAPPLISNLRLLDVEGDGRPEVVASDMQNGRVVMVSLDEPHPRARVLANIPHPAHIAKVDLDRDGKDDLLVADLGTFLPSDEKNGAVVWLRGLAPGEYEKHVLAARLPRVADAEAADFDGDGDLDVVVAAFGWRKVGAALLLENRASSGAPPSFAAPREVAPVTGAIHVPVVDLDGDGRLDFLSLFAQHTEQVVAFLARGPGASFRQEVVYQGPHPLWGSSGIEPVDFDGDGDLDVLMANGDTLDDFVVKPYHGLQLLENRGRFPFTAREIARFPGAHPVDAGDLDGDGDLDVVSASYMGLQDSGAVPAVVWVEQVAGRFERRTLEFGAPAYATLEVGDIDLDGDLDIVAGRSGASPAEPWLIVFENKRLSRR